MYLARYILTGKVYIAPIVKASYISIPAIGSVPCLNLNSLLSR